MKNPIIFWAESEKGIKISEVKLFSGKFSMKLPLAKIQPGPVSNNKFRTSYRWESVLRPTFESELRQTPL